MNRYFPFESLVEKISYIKENGVSFSGMFTKEGNEEMRKVVQKAVDAILNSEKVNREEIISNLAKDWKLVNNTYNESFDTVVEENVFWFVDSCMEYRGEEEICFEELKLFSI